MGKPHETFMTSVAGIVLGAFGVAIGVAAYFSGLGQPTARPDAMPAIITFFVSAVNTTLAANLGAVLGINISTKGWRAPAGSAGRLQWFAAVWYVAVLALAAVLWGLTGFKEKPGEVVGLLPELTRGAVGIFVAILAGVLGVQTGIAKAEAERHERV